MNGGLATRVYSKIRASSTSSACCAGPFVYRKRFRLDLGLQPEGTYVDVVWRVDPGATRVHRRASTLVSATLNARTQNNFDIMEASLAQDQ